MLVAGGPALQPSWRCYVAVILLILSHRARLSLEILAIFSQGQFLLVVPQDFGQPPAARNIPDASQDADGSGVKVTPTLPNTTDVAGVAPSTSVTLYFQFFLRMLMICFLILAHWH